ncbi:MAG: hypothetical protein HKO90_02445 [Flavobacteriaceae bacterium]|nr:hypothetical protein [Flavobacteriaceae bacterium]
MSTALAIAIFMVIFFSSITAWAFYFSERKENRKWQEKQRKEEEKELRFQKLKEEAAKRRLEIDEKYELQNHRSDEIQRELDKLEQKNSSMIGHVA